MSGETTWRLVPLNGITKEMRRGAQREARHARTSEPFSVLSAKIRGGIDAAPKPAPGLYVVSEDGTARRVEVDVLKILHFSADFLASRGWFTAEKDLRELIAALTGEE